MIDLWRKDFLRVKVRIEKNKDISIFWNILDIVSLFSEIIIADLTSNSLSDEDNIEIKLYWNQLNPFWKKEIQCTCKQKLFQWILSIHQSFLSTPFSLNTLLTSHLPIPIILFSKTWCKIKEVVKMVGIEIKAINPTNLWFTISPFPITFSAPPYHWTIQL